MHEKIDPPPSCVSCTYFWLAIEAANLVPIETADTFFTWAHRGLKGYVECNLDRAFCSQCNSQFWDRVLCTTLSTQHSYHTPILLSLEKTALEGPRPIHFLST